MAAEEGTKRVVSEGALPVLSDQPTPLPPPALGRPTCFLRPDCESFQGSRSMSCTSSVSSSRVTKSSNNVTPGKGKAQPSKSDSSAPTAQPVSEQ